MVGAGSAAYQTGRAETKGADQATAAGAKPERLSCKKSGLPNGSPDFLFVMCVNKNGSMVQHKNCAPFFGKVD